MDLEHLTKHQIVLLTLLVSFMTSIATGIVTVALMNQAPPGITRTINQVVQQTVEKVVPASQTASASNTVQKTIIIRNDDLAVQSISMAQRGIIRIVAKGDDKLIARGVIVTKNGAALTDKAALENSGFDSFEALLQNGDRVSFTIRTRHASSSPIDVIDLNIGTSSRFTPLVFADTGKLQLGQSVIRIGGVGNDTAGEGVIAAMLGTPKDTNPMIQASVPSVTPGSVLMTIFGEIIGISTGASEAQGSDFYTILQAIPSLASSTPATKSSS